MKTGGWNAMKVVLFTMVIASQLSSVAYAQKRGKPKTQKQLEITYQATKLGGYNFLQDGRRIAYSKPETEGDWTTQILYVCRNTKNSRAPKKDTPAIKVTPKQIVPIDVLVLSNAMGEFSSEHVEDRFAIVLREKPDPEVKKRRVLPDAPGRPAVPPPDLSAKRKPVPTQLAKRGEVTLRNGQVLKYFPNQSGGYTFTYMDHILFYSIQYQFKSNPNDLTTPMPFGGQSVWINRPGGNFQLGLLERKQEGGPVTYTFLGNSAGTTWEEEVFWDIKPVLERPNPVEPSKTVEERWRELPVSQ
jgi:hypothetical protein